MSSAGGVRQALTLIVGMEAREKENKSAQEWREKVFENQEKWRVNAANTAAENTAFSRRMAEAQLRVTEGNAKISQFNILKGILPNGLGPTGLSTGTNAKSPSKKAYTPQQGAFAVQAIQTEVGPMEGLSKEDKKFYQTIYENPNEAAAILDFVEGLREDGNNVNISELGKYINIYGVSKESGNKEATQQVIGDIKDQLLDPNSEYDPNLLLRNFDALTGYVGSVMNWGAKSGAGATSQEKEAEYKTALTVMQQQLALEIQKLTSKQSEAKRNGSPDMFSEADTARLTQLRSVQSNISLDPSNPENRVVIKPAELELFNMYGDFSNYSESNELFATARIQKQERDTRLDAEANGSNTLPVRPPPNSSGEPFEAAIFETEQEFIESLRDVDRKEFDKYNQHVIIGGQRIDNPGYTGENIQGVTPDVSQVSPTSQDQQPQPQTQQLTQVPPEVEQDLLEVSQAMQNEEMGYTELAMIAKELEQKYPNGEFERLMSERLSMSSSNPIDFTFDKFLEIGRIRENGSN